MTVSGQHFSVERILFATDFSSMSNIAASYAKALARRFSSSVEIAHVFDPASLKSIEEPIVSRTEEERRRLVEDKLEQLRENFSALGIDARTASREGHRASVSLLKIVTEQRIDLIVAGTHSKSGMERRVLGSTAEQLIRSAACPVFTVGPHAKQPPPLFFERIVYATDFLLEAARAAVYAVSFAEDSGAHLYVCHVLGKQEASRGMGKLPDSAFSSALKHMIPDSSYDWCKPEVVVEHGDAAEAILQLAARVHADLIVLGAHKDWSWLTPEDRGIVPSVWSRAACPILTAC
jgi:nucleotide-binding universal stress UspA family protein